MRDVGHLHGEARPHVGRLVVPHPLVALARRRVRVRRRDATSSSTTSPGRSRCASELAIFFAPTINSYKRFAARQLGADDARLGATTTARAASASSGTARRCAPETRIPGADANPYLAFAALLAAGLYGIEEKLELGPAFEGNAYESDVERFPHTLRDAIDRLERGTLARAPARRRGRRPLPELRAHRAAALRRGRHVLRAGADVRAWLSRLVGITTYVEDAAWGHWQLEAALIPYDYVRAVERAGGRALLVPPDARRGGGDARRARRARSSPAATTSIRRRTAPRRIRRRAATKPERDRGELALLEGALARDMPMLAVCRGFQVLNVARGGDLVQHLPDVGRARAAPRGEGRRSPSTACKIDDASRLGSVLGDEHAPVKSHHHQGVGRVGEGLREVGVGRRRHGRGARGSRAAVRRRRALASRRRART